MIHTPWTGRPRAVLTGMSAAVVVLLVVSCGGRSDLADVELPPSPILLIRANWAVVSSAYAALREEPQADSAIRGHFRGGSVVEVREKSGFVDVHKSRTDYWYLIGVQNKVGWVFGTYLDLYDSREQAVNASVELGRHDGASERADG